jgi:pimeloyl-ACP methyl ester carboxylesterase
MTTQAPLRGAVEGAGAPRLGAPLDESAETAVVGGSNRPGRLVELAPGAAGSPRTVTIHGINASPDAVASLSQAARARGEAVATFAWDDRHRRLTDSSRDLAAALADHVRAAPRAPLTVEAHSMGARIAVLALSQLAERGTLEGPVTLRLIAPPLGGVPSADGARHAPDFLGDLFGGLRPGMDMGPSSDFQRALERVTLPANVRTVIYLGDRDPLARPDDPRLLAVARRLGAEVVVLEGEDHVSAVERVAHGALESPRR